MCVYSEQKLACYEFIECLPCNPHTCPGCNGHCRTVLVSPSSEHRFNNLHNTVKGSCCDVFVVENLFSRSRTYVQDPLYFIP